MKLSELIYTAICTTSVVSAFAGARPPENDRPNVLLILTDDQGWGQMSNMGHPYLHTPNMDRLKAESVSFSNFLVGPVCAPTRSMLMTGRYNYRTGVTDTYQSRVNMWPDEKTVAEYLKDAGYTTGLFGKWHLGYNAPLRPCDQGFDVYAVWQEMQHSRQRPLIEENGEFSFYNEFLSGVFRKKTIDFIKKNVGRPFFCYYPLYLPHLHPDNLMVPQEYRDRFLKYPELTEQARNIYGMIEKADEEIGKVLDTLDETGLRDNTIVIFLSDNGPQAISAMGINPRLSPHEIPHDGRNLEPNGGLRGNKTSVFEGGLRVPCFIRWPGHLPAGAEIGRMATAMDILPTILDLCSVSVEWEKPLDGQSLLPLLVNSEGADWPDHRVYCMHFYRKGLDSIRKNKLKNSCVRTERYKLVNGEELYDLQCDPGETNNLAALMPDRVQTLCKVYEQWFSSVSAERDLASAPRFIGSPDQPTTYLYFFDKDQEVSPAGWPVEVVSPGPYTVCLEDLRQDMFGDHAECVLRCGDLVFRKQLDRHPRNLDLVFENVRFPEGRHTLQIDFEGDVQTDTFWRYGLKDLGHRLVWIRKEN